jgi:AICAR transformylase/IMP cyclohydrolase PurH
VIQPGGSMRDDEVIAAADALNRRANAKTQDRPAGIAMVFTGPRA